MRKQRFSSSLDKIKGSLVNEQQKHYRRQPGSCDKLVFSKVCERKKGRNPHLHEQTFWSLAGQDSSACSARPCSFGGWRPRQKKRRPRRKRCSSLCETRYLGWQRDVKNSRERECVAARKECIAMKLTRQGKTDVPKEGITKTRQEFIRDRQEWDRSVCWNSEYWCQPFWSRCRFRRVLFLRMMSVRREIYSFVTKNLYI